jgi:hypothetical protein
MCVKAKNLFAVSDPQGILRNKPSNKVLWFLAIKHFHTSPAARGSASKASDHSPEDSLESTFGAYQKGLWPKHPFFVEPRRIYPQQEIARNNLFLAVTFWIPVASIRVVET